MLPTSGLYASAVGLYDRRPFAARTDRQWTNGMAWSLWPVTVNPVFTRDDDYPHIHPVTDKRCTSPQKKQPDLGILEDYCACMHVLSLQSRQQLFKPPIFCFTPYIRRRAGWPTTMTKYRKISQRRPCEALLTPKWHDGRTD